jgi:hypothetical protein
VIHHAAVALAPAELAIAIGVVGPSLGRLLVARTRRSLLRRPGRHLTRVSAVALAAVASAAQREQPKAAPTSLEPKQLVVHRSRATTRTCPRRRTRALCSSRRPSARGSRAAYPGPSLLFGVPAAKSIGEIIEPANFLPFRPVGSGTPSTVKLLRDQAAVNNQKPEDYRGARKAPSEARAAAEVPLEEVANAAAAVLATNIAVDHDELVKLTARELGFQRTGERVAGHMSAGIAILVERGTARREGDKVVLS